MSDHLIPTPLMGDIEHRVYKMKLTLDGERWDQDYVDSTHAHFTSKVLFTPLGNKLKHTSIMTYNGSYDSLNYLDLFRRLGKSLHVQ